MNWRRVSFLLAGVVTLGGLQGCGCPHKHRAAYPAPAVAPPCDRCNGVGGPMPPRFDPNAPPAIPGPPAAVPGPPPSGAVPPPPSGAVPPPPAIPGQPSGAVPPPPAADIQQNSYPPSGPSTPPASPPPSAPSAGVPNVQLEAPEPVGSDPARPMPNDSPPPRDTTRKYAQQTPEPPAAPPAKDNGAASPAMPVDIPQFTAVKPNVASGQEPFADGVGWLKAHGYRTVLHIRAPGADDREARRSFEQNGLRYLSLEVSPQTLSKDIVDQFNRSIADPANLPLFVYDKDSSLAGGLWYLHFRLVAKESDENAREDAARLGFRPNDKGPHQAMWLAVQNYLAAHR